jgi:ketol-acid reductoisomerase
MNALEKKTIAIVGYGKQGRAHAMRLHRAGHRVVIGLPVRSPAREQARTDKLDVLTIEHAVSMASVVALHVSAEEHDQLYMRAVHEHLSPGSYLGFARGDSLHRGSVVPPASVNVFSIEPKGDSALTIAVHQDPMGDTRAVALAYAADTDAGRAAEREEMMFRVC